MSRFCQRLPDTPPDERHDERTVDGVAPRAVPAYNLVRGLEPGSRFHPEGQYNGYLTTFDDFTVYVAEDTKCVPEMADPGEVGVLINLPYTMPPEEAVGCIKIMSAGVVVPCYQGEPGPQVVADALKDSSTEVRVLDLP